MAKNDEYKPVFNKATIQKYLKCVRINLCREHYQFQEDCIVFNIAMRDLPDKLLHCFSNIITADDVANGGFLEIDYYYKSRTLLCYFVFEDDSVEVTQWLSSRMFAGFLYQVAYELGAYK